MNKMNYLMILALGLGLTHTSYATEEMTSEKSRTFSQSWSKMDENDGLRKRAALVAQYIDDENLLKKLFMRVVDSEQLKDEVSDDQRKSFKKTLNTIDKDNAIRKRFKLVAEYMDKHDVL